MGPVKIVHAAPFAEKGGFVHSRTVGRVGGEGEGGREGGIWAVDVLAHCEICVDFCCAFVLER